MDPNLNTVWFTSWFTMLYINKIIKIFFVYRWEFSNIACCLQFTNNVKNQEIRE